MEKIFVLGAGTMGSGIVQAFAQKGYEVIVRDIKDELVQSGIVRICLLYTSDAADEL